jgi:hypothetical protein
MIVFGAEKLEGHKTKRDTITKKIMLRLFIRIPPFLFKTGYSKFLVLKDPWTL